MLVDETATPGSRTGSYGVKVVGLGQVYFVRGWTTPEVQMQKFYRVAAVAGLFLWMPAGALLAQSTPTTTTPDTGAGAAPAPAPAAAPAVTAPATTPATTTTAPATTAPATATTEHATGTKKKKSARMTRQQEIDRSIDNGTVPSRYRKSVPKEYQQYIPFEK